MYFHFLISLLWIDIVLIGNWILLFYFLLLIKIILPFFLIWCEHIFDSIYNSVSNCYRITQCYFLYLFGILITFQVFNYQNFIKLNCILFPLLALFWYFKQYWQEYDLVAYCFIIHISQESLIFWTCKYLKISILILLCIMVF